MLILSARQIAGGGARCFGLLAEMTMVQIVRSNSPEAPVSVRITSVRDEALVLTASQRPMGRLPMRSSFRQQARVGTRPPQDDTFELR